MSLFSLGQAELLRGLVSDGGSGIDTGKEEEGKELLVNCTDPEKEAPLLAKIDCTAPYGKECSLKTTSGYTKMRLEIWSRHLYP